MNGWYPRLSPTGQLISGFGEVWYDNRVILSPGFAPQWLDENHIVAGGQSDWLYKVNVHTGLSEVLTQSIPFHVYAAGAGKWRVAQQLDEVSREIGLTFDPVTGQCIRVVEYNGQNADHSIFIEDVPLVEHHFLGEVRAFDGMVVWTDYTGYTYPYRAVRGFANGQVYDLNVTAPDVWQGHPVPIRTNQGPWVLASTNEHILIYPWGSAQGYVIHTGEDMNFNADAVGMGDVIRVVWQDRFGRLYGEDIPLSRERVSVAITQPPPPVDPVPTPIGPISDPVYDEVIDDVLDYVIGDANLWPRHGTHEMHQVRYPEGFLRFVKFGNLDPLGGSHETWRFNEVGGWHHEDHSHTPYRFTDGRWMKRYSWELGDKLDVRGHRQELNDDGSVRNDTPYYYRTWIEAWYREFDCGPDLGVRQVIVFVYDPTYDTPGAERHYEKYYFARGAGWFRWESYRSDTNERVWQNDFHLVGGTRIDNPKPGLVPLEWPSAPEPPDPPDPPIPPDPEEEVEIVGITNREGQFLRIDPAQPEVVHFDRDGIGPHEEVEVSQESDGSYTLRVVAANVILCGTPEGRIETRPVDARGSWEAWRIFWTPDKSRILALVNHDGRTSAILTVVRR